jgi:hypothetical protein
VVRVALLTLVSVVCLEAAVTDVSVFGATPTQAIIAYTAENNSVCKVEVSTDASYAPLVNDVNTSLFSGSDQDSRTGSLTNGRERFFVVGQRGTGTASDGKNLFAGAPSQHHTLLPNQQR